MATYYLDIETTGRDENEHKIITIQYQELDRNGNRPRGPLQILKEWELGEEGMLKKFISETSVCGKYDFDFVPVGTHLEFEHKFLYAKSRHYGLETVDVGKRPCIDIKGCLVLMNRGEFKGSGLDNMTGKKQSGYYVPIWYGEGKYDRIEEYIRDETAEFLKFYGWLCGRMPAAWREFRDEFLAGQSSEPQGGTG